MNAIQKRYVWASLAFLVFPLLAAIATRLWVLTAIPIGFLFGFFLQKGDLCGASAFSEVLLMKDWRKVWGLWVCIVTGMVGFAVLDRLGWVVLSPKPFLWASYIVGGMLFGVGMVLAGGCVSGCLFKSGTGNLNSMSGLLGIAFGTVLVEHGPLSPLHAYLRKYVITAGGGGPVTFSSVSGLPFWLLALSFAAVTLVTGGLLRRKTGVSPASAREPFSLTRKILARTWRPWQAGLMIGLLGMPAYLSSAASGRNYPLGVTHGVLQLHLLITDRNLVYTYQKANPSQPVKPAAESAPSAVAKPAASAAATTPSGKPVSVWLVLLVTSLVGGSWVSGRLSGETRLLPKPPDETVIAFFGGILVGSGAALAGGCVIGNILSGWALMSVGLLVFGLMTVLANWVTTYIYLIGNQRA